MVDAGEIERVLAENRSDLAVFNATDVEAGPVALVQLGHRVPDGFHGNWVPTEG